jgi:outer membrane protein assembly factor BamB
MAGCREQAADRACCVHQSARAAVRNACRSAATTSCLVLLACLLGLAMVSNADELRPQGDMADPHFKWKYSTGGPIYYSSPAIGPDGTIYVGTGAPFGDFSQTLAVLALHPDGALKWQYSTGTYYMMFTPAVANGVVYIQDTSGTLYALSAEEGSFLWKYPLATYSEVGQAAPAIGADGTIYVVGYAVYAIRPNGSLKWQYYPQTPLAATLRSSPAIGADGTIYVACNGHYIDFSTEPRREGPILIALDPAGTLKWQYPFYGMDWVFSSPAVADDGSIIVGTETASDIGTSYVYTVWPDGRLKWTYPVTGGRPIRSSPTVDVDGSIYIGTKAATSANVEFLALNQDGTLKWSYTVEQVHATPDDIYCAPAIGADGTIYFGAESGYLYALNRNGSLSWRFNTGAINWTSPAIAADGSLYIGSNDGILYALRSDSLGLADSPWPKFRHDNANTGRVAAACVGDCGGDAQVTVDEILTMVNIALGNMGVSSCSAGDDNDDGQITVDEILKAVNNALNGC